MLDRNPKKNEVEVGYENCITLRSKGDKKKSRKMEPWTEQAEVLEDQDRDGKTTSTKTDEIGETLGNDLRKDDTWLKAATNQKKYEEVENNLQPIHKTTTLNNKQSPTTTPLSTAGSTGVKYGTALLCGNTQSEFRYLVELR